jgi:hypothetical protein
MEKNEMDAPKEKEIEKFVAEVPKENVKALFYLFAGKPDSAFKAIYRTVTISKEDIIELNYLVRQKLATNNVDKIITTVTITFKNNKSIEYGFWESFEENSFAIPDITVDLMVKWDFLVTFNNKPLPQRHTLMVKLSTYPTPVQFAQALFSDDAEKIENIDREFAPCLIRVDFINHILSQELIKIVEDWNAGRKLPSCQKGYMDWFKEHKGILARIVHYSIPITAILLSLYAAHRYTLVSAKSTVIALFDIQYLMYWLFLSLIGMLMAEKIGWYFGKKVFHKLADIGKYKMFNLTNGDGVRVEELKRINDSLFRTSLRYIFIPIVFDIIAAATFIYLCKIVKIFCRG